MGDPAVVVDEVPALRQIFAVEFTSAAAAAVEARGRFVVAVPGGSVATTFFPVLAELPVDWLRVDIFWIDERAVPPEHPDSNYGLASRLWLQPAGVPASRVHRMRGELADLGEAARLAADELKTVAGDPPHLDLAIAGVGEDGHVASLFTSGAGLTGSAGQTGSAGLQPCPVIAIYDAPKPPPRRLTMTLPVLARARRVIVAGFGVSKAKVMHDVLHGGADPTPVGELVRQARSPLVLLDRPYSH
ncbi:MAG: 6-phosphogluconolactonase [Acidobacteria bacterium]|nr:MAG: 6-phosphogluconolactonase [Acidobacteriota bacterium]